MRTLLAVATFTALAAIAPTAQASIQLQYSIDGGPTVSCLDAGNTVSCSALGALNVVVLSANANSPGTTALSFTTGSVVTLQNSDTVAHSILVELGADGFTAPSGTGIDFLSHIGGTVFAAGAANTMSFKSCVFLGASLTPCIGGVASPSGTPSITGIGSFNDDKTGTIGASLTTPFSLGEEISITLGAGSAVNFSSSTTLTQVPEPASIGLLGAVVLLAGRLIRKRQRP